MVSLPISGVVQRESGTFFVSRPHHKLTLLFHLKYYKMKENTFESSLSAEAKNRELPIDPELRDIILLAEETMRHFDRYWTSHSEENTAPIIYELIDRTGRNIIGVLEDLTHILSAFMISSLCEREL